MIKNSDLLAKELVASTDNKLCFRAGCDSGHQLAPKVYSLYI